MLTKILDASDHVSDVRSLVELIRMAAADLPDRLQSSAIQTATKTMDEKLIAAANLLNGYRQGATADLQGPTPE